MMETITVTLPGKKPIEIDTVLHLDIVIAKLERISYDQKIKDYVRAKEDER